MTAALQADITETTWEDLAGLVYERVWAFIARYKLGKAAVPELLSEAGVAYAAAVQSYEPDKGTKLGTWVCKKVNFALMEHARQQVCHKRRPIPVDPTDEKVAWETPKVKEFDRDDFFMDLRADAAFLARLVLDSPREVWDVISDGAVQQGPTPARVMNVLRAAGWSAKKIQRAFREVREVLAY